MSNDANCGLQNGPTEVECMKNQSTKARTTSRRNVPKPFTARPTSEDDPSNWAGLVSQLMGSACRTPYNLAQQRLNALHLAAAALRHAGEVSMHEQAMALAAAVVVPPRDD